MKKFLAAAALVASVAAGQAFANTTANGSGTISLSNDGILTVAVSGGSISPSYASDGKVSANAALAVAGASVAIVNTNTVPADVTVTLIGSNTAATPGYLTPATTITPTDANSIKVTEVGLNGIDSADPSFDVSSSTADTHNDIIAALTGSASDNSVTLNVAAGTAPLPAGNYSGTLTVAASAQ